MPFVGMKVVVQCLKNNFPAEILEVNADEARVKYDISGVSENVGQELMHPMLENGFSLKRKRSVRDSDGMECFALPTKPRKRTKQADTLQSIFRSIPDTALKFMRAYAASCKEDPCSHDKPSSTEVFSDNYFAHMDLSQSAQYQKTKNLLIEIFYGEINVKKYNEKMLTRTDCNGPSFYVPPMR